MRRRRAALITLFLLVGILAVPVWLTWQKVKQRQLNQALIVAEIRNDASGVRNLLRQGANPNAQLLLEDNRPFWKRMGEILAHSSPAQVYGDSALEFALNERAVDTIKALVEAGADLNHPFEPIEAYSIGPLTTPLIWATKSEQWHIVNVLLAHKVDVNAADETGNTALKAAVGAAKADIVVALLRRGANVHASDANGTILFHAVQPSDEKVEKVRETVACLLRYGASIEGKAPYGNAVLTEARIWKDKQLILMLQEAGAK